MKIVFVHLGKNIPKYLNENLIRTIEMFPSCQIFLVTNCHSKLIQIPGLFIVHYEPDADWNTVERLISHPLDFRDGFWMKSLGRFFALRYFLEKHTGPILHVESDVLLASDFPFSELVQSEKNIAFPLVSHSQGIASTLFLRNYDSIFSLCNFAMTSCRTNSSATDMSILGDMANQNDFDIQILPSSPINVLSKDVQDVPNSVSTLDDFSGYFDGLSLGYFLFGVDPRNNRGILHVHKNLKGYFIDTSLANFRYNSERKFVDIFSVPLGKFIPIYSLHIHAKRIQIFRNQSLGSTFDREVRRFRKSQIPRIVLIVFFTSTLNSLRRRIRKISGVRRTEPVEK